MPGGALPAHLRAGELAVTALSERPAAQQARRTSASIRNYVALTKPRIIELLLVTTLPAMMLASGGWPSWRLLLATMVGGTLAAGAANVFNCWYDRDIDRLMHRTERRPLPMGEVSPRGALVFGVVLTVVSVVLLAVTTTLLAAALALGAIAYYAVLYTMVLKRHTRHSTLFGGVPGAAPVLIGWAAVTGSLAWPAVVFFGVVFCWQLPHFWALAMRFRADYARADVPMLPVVATPLSVGRQTVVWTWLTVAVSLLLWPVADGFGIGWGYTAAAAGLGLWFAVEAHRLLRRIRSGAETRPMQLFHISITYMTLLSVAIIVDVLV
ncbi:heme o synthase [Geodermatophilus sp. CPCC 206100]|uniref:heme o synthase n=1 Tax=Geodermatophilus sp. CPCC 206100 TaxID=3020054 RepID=UPI003B00CF2E